MKFYPLAFVVVKGLGAVYLFYLAIQSLRNRGLNLSDVEGSRLRLRDTFLRGALTNILNPKVAFFFLAFLPQFIHAEHGSVIWQTLSLGALFMLSGTLVNLGYAAVFSYAGEQMQKNQSFQKCLSAVSAGVFGFLAVKLILADRNA